MGEAGRDALRVGFEGTIKLEFHGAKVSSDAGLFPYRDIDQAAQLTETGAAELFDFRSGTNIQHSTIALLRQSVYSRLAGYEDTNDAERLSVDPVMRHVVGGRAVDRNAASTSQVARFETEVLTDPDNRPFRALSAGKYARLVTCFAETAVQSHSNGPAMALGTGQMGNIGVLFSANEK